MHEQRLGNHNPKRTYSGPRMVRCYIILETEPDGKKAWGRFNPERCDQQQKRSCLQSTKEALCSRHQFGAASNRQCPMTVRRDASSKAGSYRSRTVGMDCIKEGRRRMQRSAVTQRGGLLAWCNVLHWRSLGRSICSCVERLFTL